MDSKDKFRQPPDICMNGMQEHIQELRDQLGMDDQAANQPEAREPPPVPIWQLPVQPLFFEGDVNQAKSLAKTVADNQADWAAQ